MQRPQDWPERLAAFIESRRTQPFVWGTSDCALFAADAVQAVTGVDLAEGYRGTYSGKIGALRLISQAGGLSGLFDLPEIAPAFAQRGDGVLMDMPDGDSLGICLGRVIAAQGSDGIVFLPANLAWRAWKVGE